MPVSILQGDEAAGVHPRRESGGSVQGNGDDVKMAAAEMDRGKVERKHDFVDLHSHVVPDVDDGARTLQESLESLATFRAEGVRMLVTTPHLYLQFLEGPFQLAGRMDHLRAGFETLIDALPEDADLPEVRFGQEVCAHDGRAVARVVDDPEVSLGGTDFLLVEFGFDLEGDPESVIRTVQDAGRRLVIAHPERYRYPEGSDPVERMRRWRDAGAFLQINLGSLDEAESFYGSRANRLGWRLLEEGIAHLASSDHHCRQRPQILHRSIHRAVRERGGHDQASLLLEENPRRITAGLDPLPVEGLCESGSGV